MDWKEVWRDKVPEILIGGAATFIGSWFVKKAKHSTGPLNNWFRAFIEINKTKKDATYAVEMFKTLMYFSEKPFYIMTAKGEFEWANPAWCELTGFEDYEEARFMGWMRCIPDEDEDRMRQVNKDFAEHPNNSEGIITLMHIKTLVKFEMRYINKLLKDENKKPFKSLGILQPIKPQ